MINYTIEAVGEDYEDMDPMTASHKIHWGYLGLNTPWKEFPLLDVSGWLDTEDNIYKSNFTLFTDKSYFSALGNLEVCINYYNHTLAFPVK